MVAMTYDFWMNDLFGSIWAGVLGFGSLLAFIGMIGRMGTHLMISLLALYLVTMGVLFGGMAVWLIVMIVSAMYFVVSIVKSFE
jgi:hypothetical protein